MHNVLVVVDSVLLDGGSILLLVLLAEPCLGIDKLLLLHYVVVCAVDNNRSEKLVKIGP